MAKLTIPSEAVVRRAGGSASPRTGGPTTRTFVTTLTARFNWLPGGASGQPGDRRDSDPLAPDLRPALDLQAY